MVVAEIEVIDPIKKRWSPRVFTDQPVSKEMLRAVFEAARWAPSAFNEQPWRFIIGTKEDPAQYEKVLGSLNEANRSWAKTAPVIILTFAKTTFDLDGRQNSFALHDLGLAEACLMIQAAALGLNTHPMGGILREEIKGTFNLPEGYHPATAIALGYADPEHEEAVKAGRRRNALDSMVFTESWGNPADL